MIQLTDIKKAYRTEYDTLQVLKGINLEIEKEKWSLSWVRQVQGNLP